MTATDASPGLPRTGAGRHVWERAEPWWHVGFVVVALVAAGAALAPGTPRRGVALGLVAAVALAYAGLGGPALHHPRGVRAVAHVALAAPLVLVLFALAPLPGSVLLFALFPHCWRLLATLPAVVVTVLCVGAVAAVVVARGGAAGGVAVLTAVLGTVTAVLLGSWITRIAQQSAERAALVADLERAQAELAAVSRRAGALAERERLARDIHDTLAQGFTSLLLLVQGIDRELDRDPSAARRHLAMAEDTARENLGEARALVDVLGAAPLHEATLPEALRRLAERRGAELGLEVTVSVADEVALAPRPAVALLRVAQEAIGNVAKHAAASRLALELGRGDGTVTLVVHDDGSGFDPARVRGGVGLGSMRARVDELGGSLELRSEPGGGTAVTVTVTSGEPE